MIATTIIILAILAYVGYVIYKQVKNKGKGCCGTETCHCPSHPKK